MRCAHRQRLLQTLGTTFGAHLMCDEHGAFVSPTRCQMTACDPKPCALPGNRSLLRPLDSGAAHQERRAALMMLAHLCASGRASEWEFWSCAEGMACAISRCPHVVSFLNHTVGAGGFKLPTMPEEDTALPRGSSPLLAELRAIDSAIDLMNAPPSPSSILPGHIIPSPGAACASSVDLLEAFRAALASDSDEQDELWSSAAKSMLHYAHARSHVSPSALSAYCSMNETYKRGGFEKSLYRAHILRIPNVRAHLCLFHVIDSRGMERSPRQVLKAFWISLLHSAARAKAREALRIQSLSAPLNTEPSIKSAKKKKVTFADDAIA